MVGTIVFYQGDDWQRCQARVTTIPIGVATPELDAEATGPYFSELLSPYYFAVDVCLVAWTACTLCTVLGVYDLVLFGAQYVALNPQTTHVLCELLIIVSQT